MATHILAGLRLLTVTLILSTLAIFMFFYAHCYHNRSYSKKNHISQSPKLTQCISWFYKATAWVCGLDIHIIGEKPVLDQPTLVVANHISYMDVIALASFLPTTFVGKKELKSWPVISSIVKHSKGIFVLREQMTARVEATFQIIKSLRHGNVCMFPEGTTTATGAPEHSIWNGGGFAAAQRAGAQVLAVAIWYENTDTAPWVGDMALMPHLWATLRRPTTQVRMAWQWGDNPRDFLGRARDYSYQVCDQVGDSYRSVDHL